MRGWRLENRWVNWLEKCPTVLRAKYGFMNLWWASWYDFLQWSDQWREQIAGFILAEVMKTQEGKELRILPRMSMKWCLVGSLLEKEVWNKEAGRLGKSRGWLPNPSSPLTSSVNASPVTSWRSDSSPWFLRNPCAYHSSPDATVICIYDTQQIFIALTMCCQRIIQWPSERAIHT